MKLYQWLTPQVTAADYFIQLTPEEIQELEKHFPDIGSKCFQLSGYYYGFVDTRRKVFIPLKKPTYAFGGCYNDYPPYREAEEDLTIDLTELAWQEDVEIDLRK